MSLKLVSVFYIILKLESETLYHEGCLFWSKIKVWHLVRSKGLLGFVLPCSLVSLCIVYE